MYINVELIEALAHRHFKNRVLHYATSLQKTHKNNADFEAALHKINLYQDTDPREMCDLISELCDAVDTRRNKKLAYLFFMATSYAQAWANAHCGQLAESNKCLREAVRRKKQLR